MFSRFSRLLRKSATADDRPPADAPLGDEDTVIVFSPEVLAYLERLRVAVGAADIAAVVSAAISLYGSLAAAEAAGCETYTYTGPDDDEGRRVCLRHPSWSVDLNSPAP